MNDAPNLGWQLLRALPTAAISRFMSALETHRTPMHSESDRRKGGQFAGKLKALQPYGYLVPCGSVYRQAFLWGTANYFEGLDHEELILGFGIAGGHRTCVNSVVKLRGDKERVDLPRENAMMIHEFLNRNDRHAVLLVHNHPDHLIAGLLALVFGDAPMPSITDRDFALSMVLRRLESIAQSRALGKIRFYLVQNDAISEFSSMPPALLVDALRVGWCNGEAQQQTGGEAFKTVPNGRPYRTVSGVIIGEKRQSNGQKMER